MKPIIELFEALRIREYGLGCAAELMIELAPDTPNEIRVYHGRGEAQRLFPLPAGTSEIERWFDEIHRYEGPW